MQGTFRLIKRLLKRPTSASRPSLVHRELQRAACVEIHAFRRVLILVHIFLSGWNIAIDNLGVVDSTQMIGSRIETLAARPPRSWLKFNVELEPGRACPTPTSIIRSRIRFVTISMAPFQMPVFTPPPDGPSSDADVVSAIRCRYFEAPHLH